MHVEWDSLQQLLECRSADELRARSAQQIRRLGFDNWIYTTGSSAHSRPDRLNAFPPEWTAHYRREGYFDIDPVVDHCRRHTTPCLWAADPIARRAGYRTEFFSEAADYGLRAGIALPMHSPGGRSSMVSVATNDTAHVGDHLNRIGELQLVASFMHEAGLRVVGDASREAEPVHLTTREQDCLRWAAEGKTSWEIGQLLAIGERTVTFHLNNAARKLGVMGRRQAIARAMSLQLIGF